MIRLNTCHVWYICEMTMRSIPSTQIWSVRTAKSLHVMGISGVYLQILDIMKKQRVYAKTRIHSFTAELNFEDFSWELKLMSSRRSWFLENWYGNWFHLNSRRSWLLCGIAFILFQGGTDFWGALFGIEFLIVSEELILGELFGEWVLINFKAELNFEDFLWEIEI